MDINVFTAAMRAEFLNAMQAVGEPAPIERFTTEVPSTARVENYAWMTPAPGIAEYKGYRRLAQMSPIKYTVTNKEYDGAFAVQLRDIRDDQVGGYKLRMRDLTEKAGSPFKSRQILQAMANGKTLTCFDGTAMFATTHTIGGYSTNIVGTSTNTGGNLLGYTAAASDGGTYRFVMLANNGPLKPFIYQNRMAPQFNTDAGTPMSVFNKEAKYWIDLEAATAYGYWWNAVMMEITNKPTVTELQDILSLARQALRQFTLPKALDSDPAEYIHEQLEFTPESIAVVCSTNLETRLGIVLNDASMGVSVAGSTAGLQSNSQWYKKFTLIHSNYLN